MEVLLSGLTKNTYTRQNLREILFGHFSKNGLPANIEKDINSILKKEWADDVEIATLVSMFNINLKIHQVTQSEETRCIELRHFMMKRESNDIAIVEDLNGKELNIFYCNSQNPVSIEVMNHYRPLISVPIRRRSTGSPAAKSQPHEFNTFGL